MNLDKPDTKFEVGDKITFASEDDVLWYGANYDDIYRVNDIKFSIRRDAWVYILYDIDDMDDEERIKVRRVDYNFENYVENTAPCPSCGAECDILDEEIRINDTVVDADVYRCSKRECGYCLFHDYGGDSSDSL